MRKEMHRKQVELRQKERDVCRSVWVPYNADEKPVAVPATVSRPSPEGPGVAKKASSTDAPTATKADATAKVDVGKAAKAKAEAAVKADVAAKAAAAVAAAAAAAKADAAAKAAAAKARVEALKSMASASSEPSRVPSPSSEAPACAEPPRSHPRALCCPQGHRLVRATTSKTLKCDDCGATILPADFTYACAPCDHDRCTACAGEKREAKREPSQAPGDAPVNAAELAHEASAAKAAKTDADEMTPAPAVALAPAVAFAPAIEPAPANVPLPVVEPSPAIELARAIELAPVSLLPDLYQRIPTGAVVELAPPSDAAESKPANVEIAAADPSLLS